MSGYSVRGNRIMAGDRFPAFAMKGLFDLR